MGRKLTDGAAVRSWALLGELAYLHRLQVLIGPERRSVIMVRSDRRFNGPPHPARSLTHQRIIASATRLTPALRAKSWCLPARPV